MKRKIRKKLSRKAHKAVENIIAEPNISQTEAGIKAGFSKKSAAGTVSEILKNPQAQALIDEANKKSLELAAYSRAQWLKDIHEVKNRCMQAEPVMEKVEGEWVETGEFKFDSFGALKALEMIGKAEKWLDKKPIGDEDEPIHMVLTVKRNNHLLNNGKC